MAAALVALPLIAVPYQEASAQDESSKAIPTPQTELWGGLYSGMGPDEAKVVIEAVEGVRRAKYEVRQAGYSVMDVNVNSDFTLAGKKAKLELVFKDDRLLQVQFFVVDDREWGQCIVGGARAFNFFNEALGSKYALAEGTPNVDDTLVNRLALQSRAAAFEPYGEDKVDDVHALYTDGGDLLIQGTLVTTGKKYSDNAYQKMSNCNQYGFLDGYLRLIYMSKSETTALADERREERDEAARTAADDL